MTRYGKGHKEETHKRLVRLASERFRKDGIEGVGIAKLMGDAGLTHGGFYAHFKSKDALVGEAVDYALAELPSSFEGVAAPSEELRSFIDWYLSAAHRDKAAKGCPLAALGPELARRPRAARNGFFRSARPIVENIESGLPKRLSATERRETSLALLAQLAGSLQLARFIPDKLGSDQALEAGRNAAFSLAGLKPRARTSARRPRARKLSASA